MSQQHDCKSTIERAFEIAASGEAVTMERLGRMLAQEGYSLTMLTGPLLIKQLRQKMAAGQRSRTASGAAEGGTEAPAAQHPSLDSQGA